jgi:hypothetical protein
VESLDSEVGQSSFPESVRCLVIMKTSLEWRMQITEINSRLPSISNNHFNVLDAVLRESLFSNLGTFRRELESSHMSVRNSRQPAECTEAYKCSHFKYYDLLSVEEM